VANQSSDTGQGLDASIGLIIQITDLLIHPRKSSNTNQDLALELKSLQQILTLTALTIQEYADRPLGWSLVNVIIPELEQCHTVLQELLSRVENTRLGLRFTSIGDFWCGVEQDGNELVSLRIKLSNSQRLIEGFLMALRSCVSCTFQASSFTEKLPITIIKCWMGRLRKKVTHRLCIFQHPPPYIEPTLSLSGSHQIEYCACVESLGGYHTHPEHVLFHVGGALHFIHILVNSPLASRTFTVSSMGIVKITLAIVLSSVVTTK
jgi:hypothetical protein